METDHKIQAAFGFLSAALKMRASDSAGLTMKLLDWWLRRDGRIYATCAIVFVVGVATFALDGGLLAIYQNGDSLVVLTVAPYAAAFPLRKWRDIQPDKSKKGEAKNRSLARRDVDDQHTDSAR